LSEALLSATQKTRCAEAYGSALMTWSTSAVDGFIPVGGSHHAVRCRGPAGQRLQLGRSPLQARHL
jgi:hypothetical protein